MSYKDALGYENFTIPIATVLAYGGQTTPAGFLKCDGGSYLKVDYPDLFSEIGILYGGNSTNFNVPDLVTYPYIIGANLANAGFYNNGELSSSTNITINQQNIPSLPQTGIGAGFNVQTFNVTGQITSAGGAASTGGGTNCLQDAISGQTVFKTDTNTTNGASLSITGSGISVNAGPNPNWVPAGSNFDGSVVTVASLPLIYIIKARYAPEPSYPPASPTAYINDFYLRNPTTLEFNPQISGFIHPSNLTPL